MGPERGEFQNIGGGNMDNPLYRLDGLAICACPGGYYPYVPFLWGDSENPYGQFACFLYRKELIVAQLPVHLGFLVTDECHFAHAIKARDR